jgi:hypothetical protein
VPDIRPADGIEDSPIQCRKNQPSHLQKHRS